VWLKFGEDVEVIDLVRRCQVVESTKLVLFSLYNN
jgi:hypothetical protein